jgi:hypothetical protein
MDHHAPYPPADPNAPYPPYNPADYPPPPSTTFEPGHPSGYVNPPPEDLNPGNPYARPPPQHNAYYGQPRRPDDNVSASAPVTFGNEHSFASARGGFRPVPAHVKHPTTNGMADGINESEPESPNPHSEKTVQFDLNPRGPSREPSPSRGKERDEAKEDSEAEEEDKHRRHRRRRKDDERSDSTRESGRHRKRHHGDESPSDSDATIDLPPRFDEHGRRRQEDPMADKLESVLQSLFR